MTLSGRSTIFGAALLLGLCLAPAAHADNAGIYLSGSGGGLLLNGSNLSGGGGSIDLDYVPGLVGGGGVGYELPLAPIRLEGELMYRLIDPDTVTAISGTPLVGGSAFSAGGSFTVTSAMGNAYLFLPVPFGLEPYVGVGVGYARVHANNLSGGGFTLIDGTSDGLAYQGIVGVEFDFFPGPIDFGFEYRYFAVEPLTLNGPTGAFGFNYRSHTAMLRLRISL